VQIPASPSFGYQTGRPSPTDIGAAKASGKTIWTSGNDGLYSASPDGTVTQIYVDTNWQKKGKKK
jgi:hypothetical protein